MNSQEQLPIHRANDLATLTTRAAEMWPEDTAWIFDHSGQTYTFAEVHEHSSVLAAHLAGHGINQGEAVAVMLRNVAEFPLLWLALAKLDAVLVPVNTSYREIDAAHVIIDSGARWVFAAAEFTDLLHAVAEHVPGLTVRTPEEVTGESACRQHPHPAPGNPVNIQYTSGTTGTPKGCVLPHRYWITLVRSLIEEHPRVNANDTILTAQPFHYIDPQWNVVLGLASGATLVVLDRFHPSTFWDKIRAYRVTWFYCLGAMPNLLLQKPKTEQDRSHHVRSVSASAIPPQLHASLEQRFGVSWYEAFGMTETGSDVRVSEHDHDDLVGTGCIGTPTREREVTILDENGAHAPRGEAGELAIRGSGMMLGYHGSAEATEEAFRGGWFHTGDLARMDSAGRVYYLGRTKDMIRRSGENVSAEEVERVLGNHPDVALAAVIPVPDPIRGEEIEAYVVRAGSCGATADDLAEYCGSKLAYFKVPRFWRFPDELPMTPSQRVAKATLKTQRGDPRVGSYDRLERRWL